MCVIAVTAPPFLGLVTLDPRPRECAVFRKDNHPSLPCNVTLHKILECLLLVTHALCRRENRPRCLIRRAPEHGAVCNNNHHSITRLTI